MARLPAFEVPDEALEALKRTPEEFLCELRLAAAALLYDRGQVSQEIGAAIAGLDRTDFLFGLARFDVNAFQVDSEDFEHELERA